MGHLDTSASILLCISSEFLDGIQIFTVGGDLCWKFKNTLGCDVSRSETWIILFLSVEVRENLKT